MTTYTVSGVAHGASTFASIDYQAGYCLIVAAQAVASWIPRRQETIELIDQSTARRKMRLDIDLGELKSKLAMSSIMAGLPLIHNKVLIPLANLDRESHTSFEAYDAEGTPLSRFVKSEERKLVLAGIIVAAYQSLGFVLDCPTVDALKSLLEDPVGTHDLEHKIASSGPEGQTLVLDSQFMSILQISVHSYFLLVPVPDESRQVIFYQQNEPFSVKRNAFKRGSYLRAYQNSLGRVNVTFSCPTARDCKSFHVEVTAPASMEADAATVEFYVAHANNQELIVDSLVDQDICPNVAHGYIDASNYAPGVQVRFDVLFRHMANGIIRAAPFSSVLTAAVVGILFWAVIVSDRNIIKTDIGTSTALLLLFPALIGALVAQPAGHLLTAEATHPTKAMLVAVSLIPWALGLPMLANWSGNRMILTSGLSFLAAFIITWVLFAQYWSLRRDAYPS